MNHFWFCTYISFDDWIGSGNCNKVIDLRILLWLSLLFVETLCAAVRNDHGLKEINFIVLYSSGSQGRVSIQGFASHHFL